MATGTSKVYINGEKLLPYNIHVEQRSNWHSEFEIKISTEKAKVLDGEANPTESIAIENAIAYAGTETEITITRPSGEFNFKGIVTDVQLDETYAGDSFIIVKGYSPTYLLDAQPHVASFEEKSLKDIFNEVLSGFPANVKKEVKPKYTDPIPFVVRYKETQYQFLNRLAATYGEWFYYDGQRIVFGELPAQNPEVKLSFGSDSMLKFKYGINLRSSAFKQQFYKYQDNGTLEKSVASFKPGWLDPQSKTSHEVSADLFAEEGLDPVGDAIGDNNHLKYIAEAKKSSITGDAMIFKGQSADPGITVGAEVEVSSKKGFIGKYRVISAIHSFNHSRDYFNYFRAIPVTTTSPPINKNIKTPLAEAQAAEVVENNDPDKLGRVRVKFKWQEGTTPWIRVITNYAGPGGAEGVTGTYFVPEIGDEVFVEFEQGNPARPYVVGSNYYGGIGPDFADPDNNLKAIKTRSGHILQFDDTDGEEKILITDKKGNHMKIETKGDNIYVKAGANIYVEAGDSIDITAKSSINMNASMITMSASNAITMNAGVLIEGFAGANLTLGSAISSSFSAGKNAVIQAGKMLSASGGKNVKLGSGSGANMELEAKGTAKLNSTKELDLSSKTSSFKGTKKANVISKKTFIEGSSKAVVKGSKVDIS